MFNLSDKELDRLSREAADLYEAKKNTSSWEALEQRLDKELGSPPGPSVPPPRGIAIPFAYVSMIVLMIGAGYLIFKSKIKNNSENPKKITLVDNKNKDDGRAVDNNSSKEKNAQAEKNNAANTTDANVIKNKSNADVGASTTKKESDELIKSKLQNNSLPAAKSEKTNSQKNDYSIAEEKKKNNTVTNKQNLKKSILNNSDEKNRLNNEYSINNAIKKNNHFEKSSTKNKTSTAKNTAIENEENTYESTTEKNAAEENIKHAAISSPGALIKRSKIIISDSALLAESVNNKAAIHLGQKNKSLYTNRSLQIGVAFAPDFSKVKYAYANNPVGNSIGVTLGYQFLSRLSVNTGFLYEHKYYEADGKYFHPRQGTIPSNISDIDFVTGSCSLIEIPVNIRYDFSVEDNTIFFVSSGLSSYLIEKQGYSYYCRDNRLGYDHWERQPPFQKAQDFWFSMLNISAGFETNISNSFSFQINPYVKVPLRGVGIGNVQLSSYGINLEMKYSPVLKKSRH